MWQFFQKINENSLQQLSALLEAQQSSRRISVPPLSFYLRQKDMPEGEFSVEKVLTVNIKVLCKYFIIMFILGLF